MRLQFLSNEIAFTILFLLKIYKHCVIAERTCHACHGINCLRTSYNATQNCVDNFDICVTVFEGQTVVYQGCLEQLSEELRNKCDPDLQIIDQQNSLKLPECFKCNGNLCNNLASETFNCIQCDSNSDINCRSKPENLISARCLISRTPNEYCFTKREGDRIVRGCLQTLEQQAACLSSEDCMMCQPSEISDCNNMALSYDSGANGSEGNEGGGDGNGNENSGSGSSESGGDGSGNNNTENGNSGSNNEGNANDNSGGGNSESVTDSGNGGSGSESEGSTTDSSGNSSSTNGSSGSNNGGSGNDNSEGTTSSDGSNGSSITIVNTYIWIFTISILNMFIDILK